MHSRLELHDRMQRLIIGIALFLLNLIGIIQSPDWLKWMSLIFQIEMIVTGLIGWCPIMWACRKKSIAS